MDALDISRADSASEREALHVRTCCATASDLINDLPSTSGAAATAAARSHGSNLNPADSASDHELAHISDEQVHQMQQQEADEQAALLQSLLRQQSFTDPPPIAIASSSSSQPTGPSQPTGCIHKAVSRRPSRIILAPKDGETAAQLFVAIPKSAPQRPAAAPGAPSSSGAAAGADSGSSSSCRHPPFRRASALVLPTSAAAVKLPARSISGDPCDLRAAAHHDGDKDKRSSSAEQLPPVSAAPVTAACLLANQQWLRSPFAARAAQKAASGAAAVAAGGAVAPLKQKSTAAAEAAAAAAGAPSGDCAAATAAAVVEQQQVDNEGGDNDVEDDADGASTSSEEWWCGPATGLKVRDIMSSSVHFVDADADASLVRGLMAAHGAALLLVDCGPGQDPGLVEKTSMFKFPSVKRRVGPKRRVTVGDIMHRPVTVVEAGMEIEEAANVMLEADARRAIVRDEGAGPVQWVGTISDSVIFRWVGVSVT